MCKLFVISIQPMVKISFWSFVPMCVNVSNNICFQSGCQIIMLCCVSLSKLPHFVLHKGECLFLLNKGNVAGEILVLTSLSFISLFIPRLRHFFSEQWFSCSFLTFSFHRTDFLIKAQSVNIPVLCVQLCKPRQCIKSKNPDENINKSVWQTY